MKIPKLAIENYQFTLMVFILVMIAGIYSFLHMPRTEDPAINVPGATVMVIYPGANPVDLEQLVAGNIEDAVNELEDVKQITTTLQDGLALIAVEFYYGTDPDEKFDEVVQKVNSIKADLPADILELGFLEWNTSDVVIRQMAFISPDASYKEMVDEAEDLKTDLQKVEGVKKVEVVAYPDQEVRISLDFQKMAQMNITLDMVENAIMANNANIPGGSIKLSGKNFGVRTSGSYNNLEEIRNTVVNSWNGRLIYLSDIAEIEFDYEDNIHYARFQGERCIFLTVRQKEGYNIFDVDDEVKEKIEKFRKDLDAGIELVTVFDQAQGVDHRINGFLGNLLQGILLVGIVIFLALGARSSLMVIIAIPLSIIMGLFFVDMFGYGLEQISIAGLVVALGLLVDNSIVMVENINRYRDLGYSPGEAAIKGAAEIGWPIASATATTVLAFVPIIMMPDASGEFIKTLPLTIIATLVMSLLVALTLTPLIASKTYKAGNESIRKRGTVFVRSLRKFVEGPYLRSLKFALSHRWLTIGIAVLMLGIAGFMAQFIGISFFPKAEKPQFMIRINLPEGTNLDKTNEVSLYVESVLDTVTGIRSYTTNVGHGNPRIYYNLFEKNYARNFAEIFVQLHEYEVESFDMIVEMLRHTFKDYPGARINIKEFEQGHPVEAPIMIYITGDNMEVLKDISEDVEAFVAGQEGAVNVDNDLARSRVDVFVNINKDKASLYGVPVVEIDKTVRTAINGSTISKYRDDKGEEYNIVLRMPFRERITPDDLRKIYVKSMTGSMIPLGQLASVEFREVPSVIKRYDLERTALITADLEKGITLDEVMDPVIEQLKAYGFPAGYDYTIGGELESRQESFGGMQIAIIIAMIAIFAVLVLQFKSFKQPLIIYVAIPFAAIGMIWALLITGNTFSFTAFVGLISLVGIVINNSIIMVDYTNQLIDQGKSLEESLIIAGKTRFTPIILTTLTTIGGLLPLTLRGGTMWAPMGWTIIGGLLVSTFLTLIVVPVLYKMLPRKEAAVK